MAALGYENVRRLYVPVDDSSRVSRVKCISQLNSQIHDLFDVEGPALDHVLERFAFEQLHGNEMAAVFFVDFMDRADIGVVKRGRCKCFPPKSFASGRIFFQFFRKELQRDVAAKLQILGFVDNTHAAATERTEYVVMRDRRSDHGVLSEECRAELRP